MTDDAMPLSQPQSRSPIDRAIRATPHQAVSLRARYNGQETSVLLTDMILAQSPLRSLSEANYGVHLLGVHLDMK